MYPELSYPIINYLCPSCGYWCWTLAAAEVNFDAQFWQVALWQDNVDCLIKKLNLKSKYIHWNPAFAHTTKMDSYAMQRELLILGHKCLRTIEEPLVSWERVRLKTAETEPITIEISQVECPRCHGSGLIFNGQMSCWLCGDKKCDKGSGSTTAMKARIYDEQKRRFFCFD